MLVRMLRLAYEGSKLLRLPVIRKLKEAGPRPGFFERDAVRGRAAAAARRISRSPSAIAYTFGWRMQSEVLDAGAAAARPRGRDAAARSGHDEERRRARGVPHRRAAHALLAAQVDARARRSSARSAAIIPFLFPHLPQGATRIGRRRPAPATSARPGRRRAERRACPGWLRHDFRRTAVRNMVNAGVPERVAMTVTGHKTRAVFDRYHIVSPGDLQDVARRLAGTTHGHSRRLGRAGVDGPRVSL